MGAFALEAPILLTLHRGGIVSFVKSYKVQILFYFAKTRFESIATDGDVRFQFVKYGVCRTIRQSRLPLASRAFGFVCRTRRRGSKCRG